MTPQPSNSYEMQTPTGQGSGSVQDQQDFNDLRRLEEGGAAPGSSAHPAPATDPRSIDTRSTNPFIPNERAQAAAAAQGAGKAPDIRDKDVRAAAGEDLQFGSVSGNTTISNAGRVTINRIARSSHVYVPGNTGRIRIKDNDGQLETANNRKTINVTNNNNDMAVYENKGLVKVGSNRGDLTVGDGTRAGISQGRPGWLSVQRESGRVTVGENPGNAVQHYGSRSLGSALHLGGPTEVSGHGSIKMTPSGPGGKVGSPVVRGAAATLVGVGAGTTLAVGAANSLVTYNASKALAHPTPAVTTAVPSTVTHTVGLSSATGAAAHAEEPHVTLPDFDAVR